MAFKSSETTTGRSIIILAGQSGAGKSFAAATASKHFPHARVEQLMALSETKGAAAVIEALKPMPWVQLNDVAWIPVDVGALDGLRAFKIGVPFVPYDDLIAGALDVSAKGQPDMVKVANGIITELEAGIKATPEIEFIVLDTLSNLDLAIGTWAGMKFPRPLNFDQMQGVHKMLFHRLYALRKNMIVCSHLKALTSPLDLGNEQLLRDQKLKIEALKMTGGGKLTLNLNPQIKQLWQGNAAHFGVEAKRDDSGKMTRMLLTEAESMSGMEARVRQEILLDTREKVDLRALLVRMEKI